MSISVILIILIAITVSFLGGAFVGYMVNTSEQKEESR